MSSEEFVRLFGSKLSPYERDEALDFEMIYYASFNMKNKGIGKYVKNELTCKDEKATKGDDTSSSVHNHGFDNDQADYLFEQKDQIQYRYEV